MYRTRLTAVIATAALAGITLAGCSSSSKGAESSGGTVSYMTWETATTNAAFDTTMKKFEKSSGITVERESAPNTDYAQKLASLILSKKAPDFFWCSNAEAQNLAAEGLLYDWSDKLSSSDGLKASGFAPGALATWKTSDGKVAGIPTLANTYGFFYNADTFKAAGLDVPKAGWTWDELFSDLAVLKAKDPASTPLVNQFTTLISPQGASAYSVANGGKPLVDSFVHATKVQTDSTLTAAAQKFAAAIKAGQMTNPDYDATNAMAAFSSGGIPLMFGGQWLQTVIAPNHPKMSWGFAPWPAGTKANVQPSETNGVCSPATIKNPDAVWKTISYLDTTGLNDAMKAEPVAPVAYTAGSKGYYAALESGDAAAKSIAATARYELGTKRKFITQFLDTWASKAGDIVTTTWNPALEGKTSLDSALSTMTTDIRKLIKK